MNSKCNINTHGERAPRCSAVWWTAALVLQTLWASFHSFCVGRLLRNKQTPTELIVKIYPWFIYIYIEHGKSGYSIPDHNMQVSDHSYTAVSPHGHRHDQDKPLKIGWMDVLHPSPIMVLFPCSIHLSFYASALFQLVCMSIMSVKCTHLLQSCDIWF